MATARVHLSDGRIATLEVGDMTDEQIAQYVESNPPELQATPTDELQGKAATARDALRGHIGGLAAQGTQGLALGHADELGAAAATAASYLDPRQESRSAFAGQSMGDRYKNLLGTARGQMETYRAANPVKSAVANVAGGVMSPATLAAGTLLAPLKGADLVRQSTGLGGLIGATSGAGYSNSENVPDLLRQTVKGGEIGAALGGLFPAAGQAAPRRAAPPDLNALKSQADTLYQQVDNAGVTIKPSALQNLATDIEQSLRRSGLDRTLTPNAVSLVRRIRQDSQNPLTITQVETLRKIAGGVANNTLSKAEANLGGIARSKIDDFLDQIPSNQITGPASALDVLKQARALSHQRFKAETIQALTENARNQATGFENGMRVQLRSLLKRINEGKEKGWSRSEIAQMEKIVRGTGLDNTLKFLGRFGIFSGQAPNALGAAIGGGAGYLLGGPVGGVAVPLAGQAARMSGQAIKERQIEQLLGMAAAGRGPVPMQPSAISGLLQNPNAIRAVPPIAGLLAQ